MQLRCHRMQHLTSVHGVCFKKNEMEVWCPSGINPFSPTKPKLCFENNVGPDEMADNEPAHQGLHGLPFQ